MRVTSFSECHLQTWMNTFLQYLPCRHQDRRLLRTGRGEEIIHGRVRDSGFSASVGEILFQSGTFVFHVGFLMQPLKEGKKKNKTPPWMLLKRQNMVNYYEANQFNM